VLDECRGDGYDVVALCVHGRGDEELSVGAGGDDSFVVCKEVHNCVAHVVDCGGCPGGVSSWRSEMTTRCRRILFGRFPRRVRFPYYHI
jgi:hypothetical protein